MAAAAYPFKNYELCALEGCNGKFMTVASSGVLRCDSETLERDNTHIRIIFENNLVNLKNEKTGYVYSNVETGVVYGNGTLVSGKVMYFSVLTDGKSSDKAAFVTQSGIFLRQMPDNSIGCSINPPDEYCMFNIIRERDFKKHNPVRQVAYPYGYYGGVYPWGYYGGVYPWGFGGYYPLSAAIALEVGKGISKTVNDEPHESSSSKSTISSNTTSLPGNPAPQPQTRMEANIGVIAAKVASCTTEEELKKYIVTVVNTTVMKCSDIETLLSLVEIENIRNLVLQYTWIADPENFNVVTHTLKKESEIQTFVKHPAIAQYQKNKRK